MDYTQIEPEMLKCMEEDKFYPPRYTVRIIGTNAYKTATLVLNFKGSVNKFTTEVVLEPFQSEIYLICTRYNVIYLVLLLLILHLL